MTTPGGRDLLRAHQAYIAETMRIPPDKFRWYAAFHNEGHHPHIHMMLWSEDPKLGYLTKDGLLKIRSRLTNDIFKDELHELYVKKDIAYRELMRSARESMAECVEHMRGELCDDPVIGQKMAELAEALGRTGGKKQYAYMKKPVKDLVDSIVDELAKQPAVAEYYGEWNRLRDELESYYRRRSREHIALSQQKEFRAVKNVIIREAERLRLGVHTFEDAGMDDEPEEDGEQSSRRGAYRQVRGYRAAKEILDDPDLTMDGKAAAIKTLERLWDEGYTPAAYRLGVTYRDGVAVLRDIEKAEMWLRRSAVAGSDVSKYVLGKLLLDLGRTGEALEQLSEAAEGNGAAQYMLGRLYLCGEAVPKDAERAVGYLMAAAEGGNMYAQYVLGKLYLEGTDVPGDREAAVYWLERSAEQGNGYARFLLDRLDDHKPPSLLLAATNLMCAVADVFRDNTVPPSNPAGIRVDSKRRRMLMARRLAMGHRADDREASASEYDQAMT